MSIKLRSIELSISDDDICSDCKHCVYRPGDMSECRKHYGEWPADFDANHQAIRCDEFERCEPESNWGPMP